MTWAGHFENSSEKGRGGGLTPAKGSKNLQTAPKTLKREKNASFVLSGSRKGKED